MYTTSAVIGEDQKEVVLKKFMNPFLKKINNKVNQEYITLKQRSVQPVIMPCPSKYKLAWAGNCLATVVTKISNITMRMR